MSNARERLAAMMSNSGGDPFFNQALQKQIDMLDKVSLGDSGSSNRVPATRVYQRTEFRQTSSQPPVSDDQDSDGFHSINQGQNHATSSDQGAFGLHQRTTSRSPPGPGSSSLSASRLGQDKKTFSDRKQFGSHQQSARSPSQRSQAETDPFGILRSGAAWSRLRSHMNSFSNTEAPSVRTFQSPFRQTSQHKSGEGAWGAAEAANKQGGVNISWSGSNSRAQNTSFEGGPTPRLSSRFPTTASSAESSLQISEAKCIYINVSLDIPSKRLKAPVQIVLTITPADQSKLFTSQTPIAWRVFEFNPRAASEQKCIWYTNVGFSTLKVDNSDVVTADNGTHVPLRSCVRLNSSGGRVEWSRSKPLDNSPAEVVVARNTTLGTRSFALCSVEGTAGGGGWKFEPLVQLNGVRRDSDVTVGAPVMLQAYDVSGYKESQLLSEDDKARFVLSSWDGKPQPIDLRALEDETAFRLYSDHKGNTVLEVDD